MLKKSRLIHFILFFCLIIMSNVFSYSLSRITGYTSNTSNGYGSMSNQVVFEQYLNLENINVNFTQDDDYYYFEVTATAYKSFSGIIDTELAAMNFHPCPMLYKEVDFGNLMKIDESSKEPYSDARTGTYHNSSKVTIKSKVQSDYMYKYHLAGDSWVLDENYATGNGERYYIPLNLRNHICQNDVLFRYASLYPNLCINNGEGIVLSKDSSSSYLTYDKSKISGYYGSYDIKIGINKSYIDDYRYLCFAETYVALDFSSVRSGSETYTGISICSNTIDLKEYANCEHNWVYEVTDKLSHKAYCDNCKWEKNETHSLLYEYDGIHYDVCTCSYIDKVKYTYEINDDDIDTKQEVCDTYEDYVKHAVNKKTGYNFKWYEKYVKELVSVNNLSTISNATFISFVATVSEFDERAGNKSVIYKAKYSPIKYTFNYNNTNNYNLNIEEKISPQVIHYDEIAKLKSNIDVRGYVFKGWTFDKGSNKIHLNKLQDVTNYTTEDLKEWNIYPVYERMDYTIVYNAGNYSFSDGTNEKVVNYNFFDTGQLEQINLSSTEIIVNGYRDENGKLYTKLSDVQQEIERIGKLGTVIYLKVSASSKEIGSPERPKHGMGNVDGPAGGRTNILESTTYQNESTRYASFNIVEETSSLYDFRNMTNSLYDYETYQHRIISGMSDTNKEIVDEECNEDENDLQSGKIIATLSVANKWHNNAEKSNLNKLNILLMLIRANKGYFIFIMSLIFILLIIYEIMIVKHYSDNYNEEVA